MNLIQGYRVECRTGVLPKWGWKCPGHLGDTEESRWEVWRAYMRLVEERMERGWKQMAGFWSLDKWKQNKTKRMVVLTDTWKFMKGYEIGRGNAFILGRNRQGSRLGKAANVMRYELGSPTRKTGKGASLPLSSLGIFKFQMPSTDERQQRWYLPSQKVNVARRQTFMQ